MRAFLLALVLLSGCSSPGEAPQDDVTTTTRAGPPDPVLQEVRSQLEVTWSGHTKEGAWVCSSQEGTGSCPAGQQVQPDGAYTTTVPYEDNATAFALVMDWQPADASQTGLVIAVYGTPSGQAAELLASERGGPPLAVETEGLRLTSDGDLTLSVWPEGKTPTTPSVFVDATTQPFDVTGNITMLDTQWVRG